MRSQTARILAVACLSLPAAFSNNESYAIMKITDMPVYDDVSLQLAVDAETVLTFQY